jgi:glyoxylase-like metal-dependent hydrolase (beta-lactamase superfamily II)
LAEITPLRLARLGGIPPQVTAYGVPVGPGALEVPHYAFLVRSASGALVLFDLGCPDPDVVAASSGRGPISEHRTAADAVREAGHDPAEVETVVVSHLHWDHCAGIAGFPGARLLLQREELRYAFAPNPEQWHPYDSWELGRRASWRDDLDRIETLDGSLRLADDLLVLPTPGHTPGSQSLLVEADRPYLLCGDLFPSCAAATARPRTPPGIHSSLEQWRASAELVARNGWTALPAHDDSVVEVLRGRVP